MTRARIEVFPGECKYTVAATGFDSITQTALVLPGEIHRVQVPLAR